MNLQTILQTLVSQPTVSTDQQANRRALDYVRDFVAERGMEVQQFEVNGSPSLVATTGSSHPVVTFAGHMDVVPAAEDFFNLRAVDDKLYGRGVLDMKGGIAAILQAIDRLSPDLCRYDFGLMLTSDEELGGYDGVKALLQQGYRTDLCVIPDGGGPWQLEVAAKGMIAAEMSMYGKAAHSSRPWEGRNAIVALTKLLSELQEHFPHTNKQDSTLNIGHISGGTAVNQIADYAVAQVDVRPADAEAYERINNLLAELCKSHGATLSYLGTGMPYQNDPQNPRIKQFVNVLERTLGKTLPTTKSYGSGDARHFDEYDIPCAVFYPEGGGHHTPEEWVSAAALETLSDAIVTYLQEAAERKPALTQADKAATLK